MHDRPRFVFGPRLKPRPPRRVLVLHRPRRMENPLRHRPRRRERRRPEGTLLWLHLRRHRGILGSSADHGVTVGQLGSRVAARRFARDT